jgi:hypothetical protein
MDGWDATGGGDVVGTEDFIYALSLCGSSVVCDVV